MNIPVPVSQPARSRARVVAAAKSKAWRDARKAEADADAAIIAGLMRAAKAVIAPCGRMRCSPKPIDVHAIVVDAMACLTVNGEMSAGEAKARVVARLTHYATPKP